MELGQKVKLVQSWRAYSVDDVLEQGFEVDLQQLVDIGVAVKMVPDPSPENRPAKLAKKAADKVVAGAKELFTR